MLEILYQDDNMVAINKPSGLLVHRSMIDKYETEFAVQQTRDQIGQRVYPVHRLDKPTSGVLLFGLNSDAARRLTTQFTERTVAKNYLAVVRGYTESHATIDHALKEEHDKMTDATAEQDKPAQPAVTAYTRLQTIELDYPVGRYQTARYSLLSVQPKTGRKHQIRRHMKHIFHHLIGDTSHGDGKHNQLFRDKFDCHRLLLHANALQLAHPYTGDDMTITAPIDTALKQLFTQLGFTNIETNSSTL